MDLFYYHTLSPRDRQMYHLIDSAMGRRLSALILDQPEDAGSVRAVCRFVALDHPEYHWTDGNVLLSPDQAGRCQTLFFDFLVPPEDFLRTDRQILSGIQQACASLPSGSGEEDTVRALYDWFHRCVPYDVSPSAVRDRTNQTIYSVFLLNRSLCMGAAKAFALMLRLRGIGGMIALGHLFGDKDSRHAWNLVKIKDRYLHVDVTMGSPLFWDEWTLRHGAKEPCLLLPYDAVRTTHCFSEPELYPTAVL